MVKSAFDSTLQNVVDKHMGHAAILLSSLITVNMIILVFGHANDITSKFLLLNKSFNICKMLCFDFKALHHFLFKSENTTWQTHSTSHFNTAYYKYIFYVPVVEQYVLVCFCEYLQIKLSFLLIQFCKIKFTSTLPSWNVCLSFLWTHWELSRRRAITRILIR